MKLPRMSINVSIAFFETEYRFVRASPEARDCGKPGRVWKISTGRPSRAGVRSDKPASGNRPQLAAGNVLLALRADTSSLVEDRSHSDF
jgi:hypothetical protein